MSDKYYTTFVSTAPALEVPRTKQAATPSPNVHRCNPRQRAEPGGRERRTHVVPVIAQYRNVNKQFIVVVKSLQRYGL
ncbi:hypothetical protein EVAR_92107_1 [Eumeta japonica]|uniref:Uncharacterized protein n=1 Tax=Eumeta variegata TaxID=151549 RepID=A0A4C1SYE9_EUMVA|nr:hypothetical protein EVAR_92107_1 [Eumeta japonica]